jgi:hypothetical protein
MLLCHHAWQQPHVLVRLAPKASHLASDRSQGICSLSCEYSRPQRDRGVASLAFIGEGLLPCACQLLVPDECKACVQSLLPVV